MRATSQGFESLLLRQRVPRLQFRSEALFYYRVFTRVTRGFTPKAPASASPAVPQRGAFLLQGFHPRYTRLHAESASECLARNSAARYFFYTGFHPRYTRLHADTPSECLARSSAARRFFITRFSPALHAASRRKRQRVPRTQFRCKCFMRFIVEQAFCATAAEREFS